METTYSNLKTIIEFCNENSIDFKTVINSILSDDNDFEVDGYRFIHEDDIDKIQCDELKSDTYILGCFNADFLADIIPIPYKAIIAMQKAECYSELGEICEDYINEIQEEYSRLDGYGHHFSHYDGNTLEDILSISGYYVFRIN
jgi:hypothetical protein